MDDISYPDVSSWSQYSMVCSQPLTGYNEDDIRAVHTDSLWYFCFQWHAFTISFLKDRRLPSKTLFLWKLLMSVNNVSVLIFWAAMLSFPWIMLRMAKAKNLEIYGYVKTFTRWQIFLHIDSWPLLCAPKDSRLQTEELSTWKSCFSCPPEVLFPLPVKLTAQVCFVDLSSWTRLGLQFGSEKKTRCTDYFVHNYLFLLIFFHDNFSSSLRADSHCNKPCNTWAVFSQLMIGGSQRNQTLGMSPSKVHCNVAQLFFCHWFF